MVISTTPCNPRQLFVRCAALYIWPCILSFHGALHLSHSLPGSLLTALAWPLGCLSDVFVNKLALRLVSWIHHTSMTGLNHADRRTCVLFVSGTYAGGDEASPASPGAWHISVLSELVSERWPSFMSSGPRDLARAMSSPSPQKCGARQPFIAPVIRLLGGHHRLLSPEVVLVCCTCAWPLPRPYFPIRSGLPLNS